MLLSARPADAALIAKAQGVSWRWNKADADHLTKAACGDNGRGATSGRDVENSLTSMEIHRLTELLA